MPLSFIYSQNSLHFFKIMYKVYDKLLAYCGVSSIGSSSWAGFSSHRRSHFVLCSAWGGDPRGSSIQASATAASTGSSAAVSAAGPAPPSTVVGVQIESTILLYCSKYQVR